eukprot:m.293993 g.293993  ORF g.293993 m.293993 type:complete len:116 (+) comp20026_c0_seq25:615-962(+)
MFAHTSVVDLPAPPMLLPETEREACATGQVTVVAETALAVAAGLKAIYPGRCVSLYGCSRWAKAAVWALAKQSVNKHAAVLDRVYADSPGATDLDSSICIASVSYFIECDRAVYA